MHSPSATQKKYALYFFNYFDLRTILPYLVRNTHFPSNSLLK